MHFPFIREYQSDPHTERHRHRECWATKAHCHPFQASLLCRMFQICCRYNFPHFNQRNKPSRNKQNLCMRPQDFMHYSRRQCEEDWRRVASLLLAQIITCLLMFSIKLWWPSCTDLLGDNVTVEIRCEMFTRIRLVTHVKFLCHCSHYKVASTQEMVQCIICIINIFSWVNSHVSGSYLCESLTTSCQTCKHLPSPAHSPVWKSSF